MVRLLQQHGAKTARIGSDSRCGMQLEVRQEGCAARWHVPRLRYQAGELVAIASISHCCRAPAFTCSCAHTRRVLQGRATAAGLQPPMGYMPYPPLHGGPPHGSFAPPPSYHQAMHTPPPLHGCGCPPPHHGMQQPNHQQHGMQQPNHPPQQRLPPRRMPAQDRASLQRRG